MNQKQLTQFAMEHDIAYREIDNKVVLVYRDAHAEAFFMFDEYGHYAGDLDADIAHFMAMDTRRYRVMSALKLRASELGATLNRNSVTNASDCTYCGVEMDHRLNKILQDQSDESALRHLLGNAGMTSYYFDKTIDNLLSRLLSHTPLPESASKQSVQTKSKTDFDDDFDEAEHQAGLDFYAYLGSFCQSLPLQTVHDFPDEADYAQFDQWTQEKITAFRQSPQLGYFSELAKYQPSDWYMSPADWSRGVDTELKAHGTWGNYYIKFALNTVSDTERADAKKWVENWLTYLCDFDCFYEILSFFIDELPELLEYFEDSDSFREALYAWRNGYVHAETFIRELVLTDWRDEAEKQHSDYFDFEPLTGIITSTEIRQIFTAEELAMFHRYSLAEVSQLHTEDEVKYRFGEYSALAIKLDWQDVLASLRDNRFLPDLLWQTTRSKTQMFAHFDDIQAQFVEHLEAVNHPRTKSFTTKAKQAFRSLKTYFQIQGLDENSLLLWTLADSEHGFIRPYFAYLIAEKIAHPEQKRVIKEDMLLAIGWSRLRRAEMMNESKND